MSTSFNFRCKYQMDTFSATGKVTELEALLQDHLANGTPLEYTESSLDYASLYGKIEVLDWWLQAYLNHGIPLLYSSAITNTSCVAHLDWIWSKFSLHNMEFKYSEYAVDKASLRGNIEVLDWWLRLYLNHGVEMKYSEYAVDSASGFTKINVLDWWLKAHLNHGIPLLYTREAIDDISSKSLDKMLSTVSFGTDTVDSDPSFESKLIMDWWWRLHTDYNFPLLYTENCVDTACKYGDVEMLEWWFTMYQNHKLPILYTTAALDNLNQNQPQILELWRRIYVDCGLPLLYTNKAFNRVIENNYVNAIEWWFTMVQDYDLAFDFTSETVEMAATKGMYIVKLLYDQHLLHNYTWCVSPKAIVNAHNYQHSDVLEWMDSNGFITCCPDGLLDNSNMIYSTELLDWWWKKCQERKWEFSYTSEAVVRCAKFNNREVLQWWYNAHHKYGIDFLYTSKIMDEISAYNHIDQMNWWLQLHLNGEFTLKYTSSAVDGASMNNKMGVLDWWLRAYVEHDIPFLYTPNATNILFYQNSREMLDWWLQAKINYGFKFYYDEKMIPSLMGDLKEWWDTNKDKLI